MSLRSEHPLICLTGGEPVMHSDFFEIAECVHSMGFSWGMTTNATLISEDIAFKLREAGMSTVSVSLDGMEHSHDMLRGQSGSWRPINVEPIGRTCESGNLLLNADQFTQLLSFIREKRFDPDCDMEVTFGCSHYLGIENERMVRDHYFLCGAGILVAGVRCNGDICACLDIENRQDLVQGNIRKDNFMDVWNKGFRIFRRDRTSDCSKCIDCSERFICGGDSTHTWDYEKKEPMFCYRDYQV